MAVLVAFAPRARAEVQEGDSRVAALEQRVAELEAQGTGVKLMAEGLTTSWEFGAELTLLRPEIGSLAVRDVLQDELQITPQYNLNAAFRGWIGRQWEDGLGWRVVGWKFQDSAKVQFPAELASATLESDLNLYTVDLELTRRATFCGWNILSSLGARVGGIDTTTSLGADYALAQLNEHFVGGGLTFSLATVQALGQSPWSVYGGFRASLLYGVTQFNMGGKIREGGTDYVGEFSGSVTDQVVAIWEMQLGLQYERCTRMGLLFGRAGVEAQLWELPPIVAGIGDQNIGLFGPTFTVGLRR